MGKVIEFPAHRIACTPRQLGVAASPAGVSVWGPFGPWVQLWFDMWLSPLNAVPKPGKVMSLRLAPQASKCTAAR